MTSRRNLRRRFEVAFPYQDKDGKPVPRNMIDVSVKHIRILFHGYNCYQRVGYWKPDESSGTYLGLETLMTTDVEDTRENEEVFRRLSKLWERLDNQRQMYIATYRVEWF